MSHINEVGLITLLSLVCVGGFVSSTGTNSPPTPEDMGLEPPAYPIGAVVSTNETGGITMSAPMDVNHMWELTFVWYPDTGMTNGVTYPIVVHVPFDHDSGFIRIVARQVEMD
jgi:hypothetical protein